MKRWPVLTALACAILPGVQAAQPPLVWLADPLHSLDRQQQPAHLLWLDAEGASGEPLQDGVLQAERTQGCSPLLLPPGQYASLQLPGGSHLRLHSEAEPPGLWLSVDGRLWQPADWVAGSTPGQWLYLAADEQPRFARIRSGRSAATLQLSTRQTIERPQRLRDVPGLAAQRPLARLQRQDGTLAFAHPLGAGQPLNIALQGPLLLALGSRPQHAAAEQPAADYHLQWSLNDSAPQWLAFSQPAVSPVLETLDSCRLYGGLQRRWLAIPAGTHRLQLQAEQPLWLTLEHSDPQPTLNAIDDQALAQRLQTLETAAARPHSVPALDALRQSNPLQDAAGSALDWLQPAADAQALPTAEALRQQIERDQRIWRNLLPQENLDQHASQLAAAWFAAAQPLRHADSPALYLPGGHAVRGLSYGRFSHSPAALRYALPPRSHPTRLRVAVALDDGQQQTELWVVYDRERPQRLLLDVQDLQASPQEAQLASLGGPLPTLGAAFARQHIPGHYWRVASAELVLPAEVQQVTIAQPPERVLPLALQYRASQPFYLSEQASRQLLAQIPRQQQLPLLLDTLRQAAQPSAAPLPMQPTGSEAQANQWYPLLRYLHAMQASWLDDFSAQHPALPAGPASQRIARAEAASARRDWPAVLEALGTLGYGQHLRAYQLSQQALLALGEHHLARRQRQAVALSGSDTASAEQARSELLQAYARTQDSASQIRLLAALLLRSGEARWLAPLGQALLDDGQPRWASQLGLLLMQQGQTPAWLAEAARQTGWHGLAGQALAQLPAHQQALQRGEYAVRQGQLDQAIAHWQQAGAAGAMRIQREQQAVAIATDLASSVPAVRQQAIQQWIDWHQAAGQPMRWHSLNDQVLQSAGFSSLYSPVSQVPFALPKASTAVPLELEVIGPSVLRLQVRQSEPLQVEWLLAEVAGQQLGFPLFDRPTTPYLASLDGEGAQSIAQEVLLPVPAGLQRIRLAPYYKSISLDIAQWQPDAQGSALPPLTPLTLRAALAGPQPAGSSASSAQDYLQVQDCAVQPVQLLAEGELSSRALPDWSALQPALHTLKFAATGAVPDWPAGSEAVRLGQDVPAGPAADAPQALQRAVQLLWQQDSQQRAATASVPRILKLAEDWPQLEALQQLGRRASAGFEWQPVLSAWESAGVRPLPQHHRLHSPFRRVRQALLPDVAGDALWLQGQQVQGLSLYSPAASQLQLELSQPALPYSISPPAQLMLQLDDQPPRRIALPAGSIRHALALPAGAHALRLWLDHPLQQQRVLIRVLPGAGILLPPDERSWQIAAAGQPARFRLKGPLLLRIEEWTQHGSLPRYRYLPPGWQTLSLPAAASGTDRYYRLYALQAGKLAEALPRASQPASIASPPAAALPPAVPQPVSWALQDAFEPGEGYQSLGAYLTLAERGDGPAEDSSGVRFGRYTEAGLRQRWRHPDLQLYSRSDLLLRQLDSGDPVYGLRQWLDYYPQNSRWQFGLRGEAHVQPLDDPASASANPWSAHLHGEVRREGQLSRSVEHELQLALDQHWLGEHDLSMAAQQDLDPDIYTRYRNDHRRALTLGERLSWYPYLDQRLYAEAALVSNADLNPFDPDHLRLTLAAGQLFGALSVEAGLRWRHYFADDDRESSLDRRRLFLRFNGLRWGADSDALQLRSELSWDLDQQMLAWQLSFSFDDNEGGLSPALRPDENDFLSVRRALQRERVDRNLLTPVLP